MSGGKRIMSSSKSDKQPLVVSCVKVVAKIKTIWSSRMRMS